MWNAGEGFGAHHDRCGAGVQRGPSKSWGASGCAPMLHRRLLPEECRAVCLSIPGEIMHTLAVLVTQRRMCSFFDIVKPHAESYVSIKVQIDVSTTCRCRLPLHALCVAYLSARPPGLLEDQAICRVINADHGRAACRTRALLLISHRHAWYGSRAVHAIPAFSTATVDVVEACVCRMWTIP